MADGVKMVIHTRAVLVLAPSQLSGKHTNVFGDNEVAKALAENPWVLRVISM